MRGLCPCPWAAPAPGLPFAICSTLSPGSKTRSRRLGCVTAPLPVGIMTENLKERVACSTGAHGAFQADEIVQIETNRWVARRERGKLTEVFYVGTNPLAYQKALSVLTKCPRRSLLRSKLFGFVKIFYF